MTDLQKRVLATLLLTPLVSMPLNEVAENKKGAAG